MSDQETPYNADIAALDPVHTPEEASLYVSLKDKKEGFLRGVAETEAKQWYNLEEMLKHYAGLLADERANGAALAALFKMVLPEPFLCPDTDDEDGTVLGCGPFTLVDEDGCCVTCGGACEVIPFDKALANFNVSQGPEESHEL